MIKSHRALAAHIEGKSVLLMNSLGKDSVLTLEWLATFAKPSRIMSLTFGFLSAHPGDMRYLEYLKCRYPQVEFACDLNAHEIDNVMNGIYQSPIDRIREYNEREWVNLSMTKHARELKGQWGLDFIAMGHSRSESFARAKNFHHRGLVHNDMISPLGFFSKKQILDSIKGSGVKLHPCYKLSKSTHDFPSYYKMRAEFIAKSEYKKSVYSVFPLLALDEYRYECLLN